MKTQFFIELNLPENFKIISFCDVFFNAQSFKILFKNVNIMKTQIFHKMNYALKGHPRL